MPEDRGRPRSLLGGATPSSRKERHGGRATSSPAAFCWYSSVGCSIMLALLRVIKDLW